MKKALITGITGQDGSFLSELLLANGYEVHGIVMRVDLEDPFRRLANINPFIDRLTLHTGSLESFPSIFRVVEEVQPDECYHLAAQSFVSYSFDDESIIINTNINGTHFILSALKDRCPNCKFYFAGSSEMFGKAAVSPQNEDTPFNPRSAYGISKVAGFHLSRNYRDSYGLYTSNGILFNHESERRGYEFVTRKITSTIANITTGRQKTLNLGNLTALRDWGYAPDYVRAMWLMLQQDRPDDYVVATGELHSVQEFVEKAFAVVGLNWQDYIVTDTALYRAAEEHPLCGDASKARRVLGWQPTVSFDRLVEIMMEHDLKNIARDG